MKRLLVALSLLLATTGVATADGVLRRGQNLEAASLDPHKTASSQERNIVLDAFEGLTALGADGSFQPAVAQSWTTSEDGLTWTFKIRPGLKWSDGMPITSADVLYSFRRLVDPKTVAPLNTVAYAIANARAVARGTQPVEKLGVAAPDAQTIVLTLEYPAPYLPEILARANMALVPRHAIEKHGDAWIRPENVVTNGAFVLKERVANGHVKLARNPHFREPAALDTVIYEATLDVDAAVTRFRSGGLHILSNIPIVRFQTLQHEIPGETKITRGQPTMLYLAIGLRHPKLSDLRVRRALSLAIDRETLTAKVLRGGQVGQATFVPDGYGGYQAPELPSHEGTMAERLERARGLLAEAGISPKSPLRLVYMYNGANLETKRVGIALAAMWRPLGVTLVLEGIESKVLFANLTQGTQEVSYMGWTPEYPDPLTYLSILTSGNRNNYSRYKDSAYDALIARATQTADPAERQALLQKAETMMLEYQAIIPLYFGGLGRTLISSQLRGWQPNLESVYLSRYMSLEAAQ